MPQSAGAFSVDALLTAPPYIASPPFRAAILQSGTISYRGVNSTATTTPWLALASALNCSSAAGASNLACIRAANATVVQQIIDEQALTFNPTVDNVTLVYRPALQRQLGNFARVPVLAGTDAQEGRIFEFGATNASAVINAFFATTVPQIIPAVEAAYPVTNVTGYSTNYDVAARVFTDFIFTCPQSLMLNETAAQNVPTWRYFLCVFSSAGSASACSASALPHHPAPALTAATATPHSQTPRTSPTPASSIPRRLRLSFRPTREVPSTHCNPLPLA